MAPRCRSGRRSEEARDRVDGELGLGAIRDGGRVVEAVVVVLSNDLEDETVTAGHEGDALIDESVVDLRLGDHAGELAADRYDRCVIEQGPGTVAGRVDQRSEERRVGKGGRGSGAGGRDRRGEWNARR